MGAYTLDNGWERERERLAALEGVFDRGTTRHLDALGVRRGWTCLEVAGGGGSIASWLCRRVGDTGRVVATDVDPRFLEALDEPNLQVLRHDITVDDLPQSAFDLIHARLLLEHLPERDKVLERLVGALKPGGVVLIEDLDWRSLFSQPAIVTIYPPEDTDLAIKVWRAMCDTMSDGGYDREFGARLVGVMVELGLEDVGAEGRSPSIQGGTRDAVVPKFTLEQLGDRVLAAGRLSPDEMAWALERMEDPNHRATLGTMVAASGRRPGGARGAAARAAREGVPAADMQPSEEPLADRLGRLPLFAGCSADQLDRVAAMASLHKVGKDRTIVREGDQGDLFYVILSGRATVRAKRRKLAVLGPGSFFGETALLTSGPRTATVSADTQMTLAAFERQAFDELLQDFPTAARAVLEGVAERTMVTWP
jgi:SAM-dependent methyltransferase